MESKGSFNNRSGLLLIYLIRRHIHEISDRETRNRQMPLDRAMFTGLHSSVPTSRVEKCCGDASVNPTQILSIFSTMVTAGIKMTVWRRRREAWKRYKSNQVKWAAGCRMNLYEAINLSWHTRKPALSKERTRGKIFRCRSFQLETNTNLRNL